MDADQRSSHNAVPSAGPGVPNATPRDRVMALVRPEALLLLVVLVAFEQAGLFATVDSVLWQGLATVHGEATRAQTPTVIAIDDATVARLGPPPFDAATLQRIGEALSAQPLGEVLLADPWPRIYRPSDDAPLLSEVAPGVRIVVPSAVWDGRSTRPHPIRWPQGWRTTSESLAISAPLRGPLATAAPLLSEDTTWWPCAHGARCSDGHTPLAFPLQDADVPVVSLALLLDAAPGFLHVGDAGALLGITASAFEERVALSGGPRVPWVVATAQAIGSARATDAKRGLGRAERLGWLLGLYALASWLWHVRSVRSWLALGPVFGLGIGIGASLMGSWAPPLVASALVVLVPVGGYAIAVARASVRVSRRLGLLVIRAASRAGTLRRRIADVHGLLEVLADLTRSHAEDLPFALILVPARGKRLEVVGTYGVVQTQFRDGSLMLDHPEFVAAAESTRGVEARTLLKDGTPCRVIPLRQSGTLVAYWCLAAQGARRLPDAARLGTLAQWVGERLALPGQVGTFSASTSLVPESTHDEALENLFLAADEERRRWLASVQALGIPVLVTDVAGVVSTMNQAMESALSDALFARVRSIRELVVLADGDVRIERWMRRLYTEGRGITVRWPDEHGSQCLVVRPVSVDRRDAGTSSLLGYVAWVEGGLAVVNDTLSHDASEGEDATELYLPRLGMP